MYIDEGQDCGLLVIELPRHMEEDKTELEDEKVIKLNEKIIDEYKTAEEGSLERYRMMFLDKAVQIKEDTERNKELRRLAQIGRFDLVPDDRHNLPRYVEELYEATRGDDLFVEERTEDRASGILSNERPPPPTEDTLPWGGEAFSTAY